MAFDGIAGHHDILCHIPLIGDVKGLCPLLQFHQPLGMGQTGGTAQNNRGIIFLTEIVSIFHEFLGFGTVGGLHNGDHSSPGHHPAVLLILRAVHARVICHHQHQSAPDAGVCRRI